MWAWSLVTGAIFIFLHFEGLAATSHERRLLSNLLENYNVLERPVAHNGEAVLVKFGLSLLSINEVDEKGHTMDTTFWLTLKWNDVNLRWNPADYDNITDIRIPIQRIWQPDIHVANSQRDTTETTYYETMVVVKNDGNTIYAPPGNHKTSCTMNFSWYPMDRQKCEIRFGSWTYDSGKLNLSLINDVGDISSYVGNNEWDLKGVFAQRTAVYFGHSCCDPYVKVGFTIHLQRKGDFILCCSKVLNGLICFMILASFVLSPQSGQKLVIGIGLMICNIWILAYIQSVLPSNFHCQLRQYFLKLCALVLSSIIANMFTIFLHYRIHPMSAFVRRVFVDRIPNILCTCCPRKSKYLIPAAAADDGCEQVNFDSGPRKEKGPPPSAPVIPNPDFQDLLSEVHYLKRKLSVHEDNIKSMNDWNYLASVVDRLFAIIYAVLVIVFVVVLFPSFSF